MYGRIAPCTVKGASQRLHGGTEYNHDNLSAQPVVNSRYQAGSFRIQSTRAAQYNVMLAGKIFVYDLHIHTMVLENT
jgi:hypothetical protein